jgi:glycosyltransferase involved in cell wall biosynthesis
MNVLLINYYYAPVVDAHVYRWEQIVNQLIKEGHTVDVVTGKHSNKIKRVSQHGLEVVRIGLLGHKEVVNGSEVISENKNSIVKKKIIDKLKRFYRLTYWPDFSWHWAPFAVLEVLKRRKIKYDYIVSYYPCASALIAGALAKKVNSNKKCYWIVDFGDPFSLSVNMQPNNFSLYDKLNITFEKWVINRCDLVCATSKNIVQEFVGSKKVKITPHMVDIDLFYSMEFKEKSQAINLVYVGGFHKDIREPYDMIELVSKISKTLPVRLSIYGPDNGFDLVKYDSNSIKYYGCLERGLAIEQLKNADILVNIENKNCKMIPSKIVEYIATGRPILNFKYNGVDSPSMNEYESLGYVFTIYDKKYCNKKVSNFLKDKRSVIAPKILIEQVLNENLLESVMNRYFDKG